MIVITKLVNYMNFKINSSLCRVDELQNIT